VKKGRHRGPFVSHLKVVRRDFDFKWTKEGKEKRESSLPRPYRGAAEKLRPQGHKNSTQRHDQQPGKKKPCAQDRAK